MYFRFCVFIPFENWSIFDHPPRIPRSILQKKKKIWQNIDLRSTNPLVQQQIRRCLLSISPTLRRDQAVDFMTQDPEYFGIYRYCGINPSITPVIHFLVGDNTSNSNASVLLLRYQHIFWPHGQQISTHPNAELYVGVQPQLSVYLDQRRYIGFISYLLDKLTPTHLKLQTTVCAKSSKEWLAISRLASSPSQKLT